MSFPGFGPSVYTTCAEITCKIRESGKCLGIIFIGAKLDYLDLGFYRSLRDKLFAICREHVKNDKSPISPPNFKCFYFTLSHDEMQWDVQCLHARGYFRIYLYYPTKGLPDLFSRQESIRAEAESRRIRDLLEAGLIREDVFTLYYQPIVQIGQNGGMRAIKGAEAFMRVRDQGALHNPKKYLDIAEADLALMRKLGYKILELACSDLKWFKAKFPLFTVSLNTSEKQFTRFDDAISFERIFSLVKEQYGIDRHDIALEVPEVTVESDTESAAMLKRLFDGGTPIILDNFSMGALVKDSGVEIDKYKISGRLLRESMGVSQRDRFVARDYLSQIFSAARKNGRSVVAKEVETAEQIKVLLELGFDPESDLLQGNVFCPPMDLRSFESIYQENMVRLYHSQLLELFKHANIRVLSQNIELLIDICAYFNRRRLTNEIAVGQSFSELWSTNDRNLVVIMDYNFVSQVVSPDQLKDGESAEETWRRLIGDGSLFEIPGLDMALINNFQDRGKIADKFNLVEEYDGHNLYQILVTINREKTEKIPFIILSRNDSQMKMVEENVIILNNLDTLGNFEDSFVQSLTEHPGAISKFNRF